MDREEIIRLVRQLDPALLALLAQFLDRLEDPPENPKPGKAPDPEDPEA